MGTESTEFPAEQRLERALDWLRTSRRDYHAYKKLVRRDWLPFICKEPDEPQVAINHLQQCVEKMVKAIAFASSEYSYQQLMKTYGHDSLLLCIDILLRLVRTPLVQIFLDTMEGRIFRQSKAELYSHNEAIRRLIELREKSKLESTSKEMNEWAYEFATLPRDQISKLVGSQRKAIKSAKMGAVFLHLIPMRLLKKSGHSSSEVYSKLLNSLIKRGFLLSDKIQAFFKNEKIASFMNTKTEEQRLSLIKNLGDLLVSASVLNALLVLSALTYAHAISPKYPGDPADLSGDKRKLSSESYTRAMGIVGSLISVGRLTSVVLKESEREVAFITTIFGVFGENPNELIFQ